MPNRNKEAAGILRGVIQRVEALEEAVTSTQGIPNLLRIVTESGEATDTATVADVTTVDRAVWDTDSWNDSTKQWG